MEHVVTVTPCGRVVAMHSDKFPLDFLGQQDITRASDIRWDMWSQSWGIWFYVNEEFIAPHPIYQGFPSYEAARRFEIVIMNECMKSQLPPTHNIMIGLAALMVRF